MTFFTNSTLVILKSYCLLQGYYKLQALSIEKEIYKMMIRLECGVYKYVNMPGSYGTKFNQEALSIMNNLSINIENSFRSNNILLHTKSSISW